MKKRLGFHTILGTVCVFCSTFSPVARAELQLEYGGRIQSNVRFRANDESVGRFYDRRALTDGVDRDENILKLKLSAVSDRYSGVVDVDFIWYGFQRDLQTFSDLYRSEKVQPLNHKAHALYLEAVDLFVEGLDFRLGQQTVSWGVGDMFNPTNTLNSPDLEDPLLFGAQQGNLMARADFTFGGGFTLSGALVPLFQPALLPYSSQVAVGFAERLPHLEADLRHRIFAEMAASQGFGYPTVVRNAYVKLPDPTFKNMQFEFRAATNVLEQDIAFSYYNGFIPFPVPADNFTEQSMVRRCNPDNSMDCVDGLLQTDVTLTYPKVQVAGFNTAGQLDLLGWLSDSILPIGYRIELGVYFPKQQRLTMRQGAITVLGVTRPAGEYDYPGGQRPLVLDSTAYAKWVLGLDYTFGHHVYLNVQWVHGLVDEIGAGDFFTAGYSVREGGVSSRPDDTISCAIVDEKRGEKCAREIIRRRLGDYLAVDLDFKFDSDALLLRMFTLLDLTGAIIDDWSRAENRRIQTTLSPFSADAFSVVLYPEINYNFGNGLELGFGALAQLGKSYTKFGDPAAGGIIIWTRGRYSF